MPAMVAIGNETQVNTYTAGEQVNINLTGLADGGYVATWDSNGQDGSGYGIYGQRYDASGTAVGTEFQINTVTANQQVRSSVSALSDGGFVVTWDGSTADGSGYGIVGRIYNAAGEAAGNEFVINATTFDHQFSASVSALEGGGFVVSWQTNNGAENAYDIVTRRFDGDGTPIGGDIAANTPVAGNQTSSAVAGLEGGGYIVTWQDDSGLDSSGYGIFAQRYNADGTAAGGEFLVNTTLASYQIETSVTAMPDGGFVVTWSSWAQDGDSYGIFGQRFDESGAALGSEFQINTYTTDFQTRSDITALADGGFVVTWQSSGQDGSNYGVYAQRFDAAGAPVGGEVLVNTTTSNNQYQASVTALEDGGFVIGWQSSNAVDNDYEVFIQQYKAQLFGTQGADTMSDTAGADWMRGRTGDDTLYGLEGNDKLIGGAGADALYGGEGNDKLKGGNGNDTLVGGAGKDALIGGAGADTFVFLAASDSAAGAADRIRDFEQGVDLLDFSAFGGLSFIGNGGFSGTGGEVRAVEKNGNTILRVDVDGDGAADMKIFVKGLVGLTVDDFIF